VTYGLEVQHRGERISHINMLPGSTIPLCHHKSNDAQPNDTKLTRTKLPDQMTKNPTFE